MPPEAASGAGTDRIGGAESRHRAGVLGGGPAGLAAAIVAARVLGDVVLVLRAAGQAPADTRTAALFPGTVQLLRRLGVWSALEAQAAALTAIRIVDATGHLLKAPEALFSAREIGIAAFGYNIANEQISSALAAAARQTAGLQIHEVGTDAGVTMTEGRPRVVLAGGPTLSLDLLIGADGRQSCARQAAGIATRAWSYPQVAIATSFTHSRPHGGVSTEFHRAGGPLTTVPLIGTASSLVWVERPERAEALMALDETDFVRALEHELMGLLGAIRSLGPRRAFPLAGLTATSLSANRTVLVGEAGHVLPPIGAQGLNLGLRDAAALADCLADAAGSPDADPGAPGVLAAYEQARRSDVAMRAFAVDLLNRSLLPGLLPFQALRGAGLHVLNAVPPLRHLLIQQGLEAPGGLPRLMRETEGGMA